MAAPRPVLALIGLRCSGKTTLGRALEDRLDVPFGDLDDLLVDLARERLDPRCASAGELLAGLGESVFRDLESHALERVLRPGVPFVLATGGGVVERAVNRERLRERALCVWLRADLDTLRARLRADPTLRPPLLGGGALGGGAIGEGETGEGATAGDAADELELLAHRRDPFYASLASLELDTAAGDAAELAERLLAALDPGARPSFAVLRG